MAVRRKNAITEASRQVEVIVHNTSPRGTCTALDLAVMLAHARSREIVVISDGFSNCPMESSTVSATADDRDYSWLTFLLIPTRDPVDQRWAQLAERISKLEGRYPNSRIRPYNELTSTFWTR